MVHACKVKVCALYLTPARQTGVCLATYPGVTRHPVPCLTHRHVRSKLLEIAAYQSVAKHLSLIRSIDHCLLIIK